ncbi:MAG: hypothetical protein D6762_03205 [Candidatus Neomarinimicrobiota bacterium]|nr:MAG: hypothetical protein D6762_03205 [Candidatus Neomarinimicrobiota bacterium]
MITFASGETTAGSLPAGWKAEDFLSRDTLEARARYVYDRTPNLVALLVDGPEAWVVKYFGWRHPLHFSFSPTFPSRAETSWKIARALLAAGVPTPEPIWTYTRRHRGFIFENVLLTRAIHPHRSLRQILREGNREHIPVLLDRLGTALARMHRAGIQHRDLTTGNFLVAEDGSIYIVDLNRARRRRRLTVQERLEDLKKIHFPDQLSATITAHFWTAYRDTSRLSVDWEDQYRLMRARYRTRRRRRKQVQARLRKLR